MSDFDSYLYAGLDPLNFDDRTRKQPGLEFISFQPLSDDLAPHPDLFELEIDSSLAACDLNQFQLLTVDTNDVYSYLRSDTPTRGPLSNFTVSSESAYDSLSSHSESLFNYPQSPYSASNYSFSLNMDFEKFRLDTASDYAGVNPAQTNSSGLTPPVDQTSFGALPMTPPQSPPIPPVVNKFDRRTSFSDYGPPRRDFYGQVSYSACNVSQSIVAPQPPIAPVVPIIRPTEEQPRDPMKKYQCNACPRGFARAYNLKTHMATHDPNRLKPHTCPHRACGRAFSRKHDLGRHLVSIHRDDPSLSSHHSASSKKSIGVDKKARGWCESCGKSWFGKEEECQCQIK